VACSVRRTSRACASGKTRGTPAVIQLRLEHFTGGNGWKVALRRVGALDGVEGEEGRFARIWLVLWIKRFERLASTPLRDSTFLRPARICAAATNVPVAYDLTYFSPRLLPPWLLPPHSASMAR